MKPKSILILLIFSALLLSLGGCPKKNETWDKNASELKPVRRLSEEEQAELEELKRDKYSFNDLSGIGSGLDNGGEREREVKKLKTLVEEIRENCQMVTDNYLKIINNLSYSDCDAFFKDEEKARIQGKYDVCSDILARMEEKGID